MINQAWLIPLIPFAAFAVIILFMRRSKEPAGWLATAAVAASFAISLVVFQEVMAGRELDASIPWLRLDPQFIDPNPAIITDLRFRVSNRFLSNERYV